jgi:peptide/nickel transport system permease protein
MLKMILRRTFAAVAVLWAVSIVIFVACEILPGDVAEVRFGQFGTQQSIDLLREELGLNRPAVSRYLSWIGGLVSGNWGMSFATGAPVADLMSERLANTARLGIAAALISVPLALGMGILMALWAGSLFDRISSVVLLGFAATPEFLVAALAILFFAVHLGWFPAVSYVDYTYSAQRLIAALVMPVGVLMLHISAQIARMTRVTIVNVLQQPYIEMALLKGATPLRRMFLHALPNIIGPVVNVVAINVAYLVSGVVIVETVFAYPGIARLMIDAVSARDMPVIQACAMIVSSVYVVLILAADLIALVSNPRLRHARPSGANDVR